jgi:hypothetical protein
VNVPVHRAPCEEQHHSERNAREDGPNNLNDSAANCRSIAGRAERRTDDGMENRDVAHGAARGGKPEHRVGEAKRHG